MAVSILQTSGKHEAQRNQMHIMQFALIFHANLLWHIVKRGIELTKRQWK